MFCKPLSYRTSSWCALTHRESLWTTHPEVGKERRWVGLPAVAPLAEQLLHSAPVLFSERTVLGSGTEVVREELKQFFCGGLVSICLNLRPYLKFEPGVADIG